MYYQTFDAFSGSILFVPYVLYETYSSAHLRLHDSPLFPKAAAAGRAIVEACGGALLIYSQGPLTCRYMKPAGGSAAPQRRPIGKMLRIGVMSLTGVASGLVWDVATTTKLAIFQWQCVLVAAGGRGGCVL